MKFLKIIRIIRIVFAVFVFICKRNKIDNCLIILFKALLAQTHFASFYNTTKILLPPITTTFFSCVNLSKEDCVHHIEHEHVVLTAEEIYFCMIDHQIHQLLHMQVCSFYVHGSILGMYLIARKFYQNDLDTTTLKKFPHSDKKNSIEKTIVLFASTGAVA